ncbi:MULTISPECIES: DUF2382 domain-containing protein [Cyanophyceae]|uniref:Photosystem reaction center subunit H n=1 Tax=Nodularia spumigena CENA596 TaxID=1819295 RepID=A0A166J776_NODSP|nr:MULTISPECIES: DUF2382 domain-containing protein [Cyanophyceae]MDB9355068.1 DUF2382 domain-containing protein [Nodularia spumigena CS-587/03]KZL49316.1 photosystem reaction center subunit H [Nodularia spumigena CENA596]MDB9338626.1 DUF2382 domain-containing protein [Nodularia spumigena CS-589/07]MDB9343146.1 DUF2382 domain-containing protein [Nodularia spumigena CS-588/06]MDB9370920.1 DUF2382 domain-containing protein [Nodularia spumigena CS-586/05]
MVLYKLEDLAADYTITDSDNYEIRDFDVYSDINNEKVGHVKNILVDETGSFRYLVVDTGFWIFGKQVLLPIGRSRISYADRRVYATGLTQEQVESLPDFNDLERVDYDYEEQVRGVYRTPFAETPLETSTPVEATAPLDTPSAYSEGRARAAAPSATYDRDTYTYDREPDLYHTSERNHQNLKLYEERLIANKSRVKTGEVAIGKHVETERANVSVPVEKERVVIERTTPTDAGRTAAPDEVNFREGEVARMDVYEENADIRKEAVVREEVKVKKVVEEDTVEAQENLRREELDVNKSNDRSQKKRRI